MRHVIYSYLIICYDIFFFIYLNILINNVVNRIMSFIITLKWILKEKKTITFKYTLIFQNAIQINK